MTGGRGGFSLVELIVALTILSITLLGLAGAAAVAHRSFLGAEIVERATNTAALVLDSLVREPAPRDGERHERGAVLRWSIREDTLFTHIDLAIALAYPSGVRILTFSAVHHAR